LEVQNVLELQGNQVYYIMPYLRGSTMRGFTVCFDLWSLCRGTLYSVDPRTWDGGPRDPNRHTHVCVLGGMGYEFFVYSRQHLCCSCFHSFPLCQTSEVSPL